MKTNGYATKEDLKKLERNVNLQISELTERVDGLKNQMVDTEVKILGELQKMREDNAAHQFSHMRINDDIQELQEKAGVFKKK